MLCNKTTKQTNLYLHSPCVPEKVWNSRTTECLTVYRPGEAANDKFDASASDAAIQTILPLPLSPGESEQRILVCVQGPALHMFSLSGAHLRTFERDRAASGEEFNSACISPQGRFAYAIAQVHPCCKAFAFLSCNGIIAPLYIH